MALLPRTSNNRLVNPTPQTSVNPILPHYQTRRSMMCSAGNVMAARFVAPRAAHFRLGCARLCHGPVQPKWACVAHTASSGRMDSRPAAVAHALRPHSHADDSREQEHHSKQIALLAMVPIGLMSLKWAVSIGPAALFVPAMLLAVPIAGTGLRQLLAEGLTMFMTCFAWINHHQAQPVRVRHTAPAHMLEPQHMGSHPQAHYAPSEHMHHHLPHSPHGKLNGGPAAHPPSPKPLPSHSAHTNNGGSPQHSPMSWSRQQQQVPPQSPQQSVGVAHMPYGHVNNNPGPLSHPAAPHMMGGSTHAQAGPATPRHSPAHHQLPSSPSKQALRSRSTSPEPTTLAAGASHMQAAAMPAQQLAQEVLDADSMDWPVSDPQPAELVYPSHPYTHQHGVRNTHIAHARVQGSHSSFSNSVGAYSVLALQQQQQSWQHGHPMASANAQSGVYSYGQMHPSMHTAAGHAG